MGYYIRVLGIKDTPIDVLSLRREIPDFELRAEDGNGSEWNQLILRHISGPEIAIIERNPVKDGEQGKEELQEFIEEVPHYYPRSAARAGGILQADAEGFSNEDGYHILWQFPNDVTGTWSMAVLNESGTWSAFEMELGDQQQKDAFLNGQIPQHAKR